ncbi:hypothetical protein MMPV_008951 [Pyropia vietnamensis]
MASITPVEKTPQPEMTSENWAKMAAYVEKLGQEAEQLRRELEAAKVHVPSAVRPQLNKPNCFSGRPGSIDAWAAHMDVYVSGATPTEALLVATSYLEGEAFSWWQSYSARSEVCDWQTLREALKNRFNPPNKVQAARDLLHKWKQVKDVSSNNKSFQSIILDIPDITVAEIV